MKQIIQNPNERKHEKLAYLDGLRGIACLMVAFGHFFNMFFPLLTLSSFEAETFSFQWWEYISLTPLNILVNAHFAVIIFFTHSAIVLTYNSLHQKSYLEILADALKRYVRLMPIVAISIVCSFLFFKLNFYQFRPTLPHQTSWYTNHLLLKNLNFQEVFYQMFIANFFGDHRNISDSLNSSLWSINLEYKASMIIFFCLALAKLSKKTLTVFLLVISYFYYPTNMLGFLSGFLMSMVLIQLGQKKIKSKSQKSHFLIQSLGALLIGIGAYLGSIRSYLLPGYAWWKPFQLNHLFEFSQILGASSIIFGIYLNEHAKKILESKPIAFLGKISYSIYGIHVPLLFALCPYVYIQLINAAIPRSVAIPIVLVIWYIVVLICGYFIWKYVDYNAIYLSKKLKDKFLLKIEKFRLLN